MTLRMQEVCLVGFPFYHMDHFLGDRALTYYRALLNWNCSQFILYLLSLNMFFLNKPIKALFMEVFVSLSGAHIKHSVA